MDEVGAGGGDDGGREAWIESTLAALTTAEKVALCAGADTWTTVPIERVGVPALKMTDGPIGARGNGLSRATAACFPCGTALGATWNPDLLEEVGAALAHETRTKGAQLLLGPTVNLHRSPLGGRNFECYSEDPLLTAHLAAAFVTGLQDNGIGACIKHYVGNESEHERRTISVEMSERALRELYLRPFEHVMTRGHAHASAKPWAVMGAYNLVGGEQACAHDRLLNQVLKGEWGFDGLVVSDWGALHDTVRSANGGCDLEMPGPPVFYGDALLDAVGRGEGADAGGVGEDVVDGKVRRLLRTLWRSSQVRSPVPFDETAVDRPEDHELIRRVGAESMVLLVNRDVLPLDPGDGPGSASAGTVAVVGPLAERASLMGGGSSFVVPHRQVHPLAALRARLGDDRVVHAAGGTIDRYVPRPLGRWFTANAGDGAGDSDGRPFTLTYVATDDVGAEPSPPPPDRVFGERAVKGVTWTWWTPPEGTPTDRPWGARWTAAFVPDADGDWTFGVTAIGRSRVLVDDEVVCDNWTDPRPGEAFFARGTTEVRGSVALRAGSEYRLVVEMQRSGDDPPQAAIRFGIAPPGPDDPLAGAVEAARRASAAIVVVGTDGEWETEGADRVDMRLPGRQDELVRRVAAVNPRTIVVLNTGSPVEMPWIDDVGAVVQAWFGGQAFGDALADVLVGAADPGGRLPTTFPVRYEDNPTAGDPSHYPGEGGQVHYAEDVFVGYRADATRGPEPLFPFGHGLSYTSFAFGEVAVEIDGDVEGDGSEGVRVTLPVTNTGPRPGSTVVQLYVRPPAGPVARPDRELKAFAKVRLDPGASTTVRLALDRRAFARFDPAIPGWTTDPGDHQLLVGTSSTAIVATATIVLPVLGTGSGAGAPDPVPGTRTAASPDRI